MRWRASGSLPAKAAHTTRALEVHAVGTAHLGTRTGQAAFDQMLDGLGVHGKR